MHIIKKKSLKGTDSKVTKMLELAECHFKRIIMKSQKFEEKDDHNKLISLPDGSDHKVSACSVGDLGSIPGLGRSPGEGNGNPLQYSCLENSMD